MIVVDYGRDRYSLPHHRNNSFTLAFDQHGKHMSWRKLSLLAASAILIVLLIGWLGGSRWREWFVARSTDNSGSIEIGPPLKLFSPQPIGKDSSTPPRISYVQVVDLDRDGLMDILVCDCVDNTVSWIRQTNQGEFQERVLADNLVAPARVECVDYEGDGDLDIFVAVLGKLFPTNDHIGSLVGLENLGNEQFQAHVLLENIARASDIRSGDLDGDQDLDLVLTQFGYDDGQVQWLENLGDWKYTGHLLQSLPGGIHGIVADVNGDQALDIVTLISQQHEQTWLFLGDGRGKFKEELLYKSENTEFGSAGIWLDDLDGDRDLDILYCNGDALDYSPPRPWPWHGVQWLENLDGRRFKYHRIVDFGGAVTAQTWDFDGDGDTDIFVSSAFNEWEDPNSQSLILLENDGKMKFVFHALANSPTHLQAMAAGDVDGDGRIDLVTGGMHVAEPYDRVSRIMLWRRIPN